MFEDAYRKEMSDLHASESLISDTLKNMQAEQAKLQSGLAATAPDEPGEPRLTMLHSAEPRATRPAKKRRPLFMRIGLPAAACLVIAVVGAMFYTQMSGIAPQGTEQNFVFQQVQGDTSLMGDLQFGSLSGQAGDTDSDVKRAECPETFLPAGILDAPPVTVGRQSVYLGFDEQQTTYYAAYLKDPTGNTWVLLKSSNLDEHSFIQALEGYFKA